MGEDGRPLELGQEFLEIVAESPNPTKLWKNFLKLAFKKDSDAATKLKRMEPVDSNNSLCTGEQDKIKLNDALGKVTYLTEKDGVKTDDDKVTGVAVGPISKEGFPAVNYLVNKVRNHFRFLTVVMQPAGMEPANHIVEIMVTTKNDVHAVQVVATDSPEYKPPAFSHPPILQQQVNGEPEGGRIRTMDVFWNRLTQFGRRSSAGRADQMSFDMSIEEMNSMQRRGRNSDDPRATIGSLTTTVKKLKAVVNQLDSDVSALGRSMDEGPVVNRPAGRLNRSQNNERQASGHSDPGGLHYA